MAAKKYTADFIALELEKFERKIQEFQEYLNSSNPAHLSDAKERQGEFTLQLKMMLDLGTLLSVLASLREKGEKAMETRGGVAKSGLMSMYDKHE